MRTSIITRKDKTTLTIVTKEDLYLDQMDAAGQQIKQIKLTQGVNNIPVGAGVFRVLSKAPVTVTADTADVQIAATAGDKDGSIDPLDAKGQAAPQ